MIKVFFTTLLALLCISWQIQAMTPEQLVQLNQVSLAKLSPDGKTIAYVTSTPRDPILHKAGSRWQELTMVNNKGMIRPLITGKNEIKRIQWNAEGNQIWLLMRREHEQFYNIYMIRSDGGEALKVIGRDVNIHGFHLSQSGEQLLYWLPVYAKPPADKSNIHLQPVIFEEQAHLNNLLFSLNLKQTNENDTLLPVSGHILDARFSPKENRLLIKRAPSYLIDDEVMHSEFLLTDVNGKTVSSFSGFGKISKAIFSPDGSRIAFIGALTPSSPDHGQLYIGEVENGDAQLLLHDFEGMVTDIAWSRDRQMVFSADIGTRSVLGQKKTASPSKRYKTLADNSLILSAIHSSKNSTAVIANSPLHPNELFWFRDGKMLRISQSNPELENQITVRQTSHQYPGDGGLGLEGIMVSPEAPDEQKNQPLPTVIFVHGGPESHVSNGWVSRYSQPAHVLAEAGFRSFFPNYRGSSGRGDAFLKLGQNDYAGAEFDDILATKNWLVDKGYSHPDKIAIIGASYGGYAAAWGATKFSEHFRAAIMISGISHKVSKFGTTDIPTEMLRTHALSNPWENWETWLKASPIYYSELHNTPLLIMHGIDDSRVHYSQSMEMYRHLKLRNKAPVRLVLYPGQGHSVSDSFTQRDMIQKIVDWLEHFILQNQTDIVATDSKVGQQEKETSNQAS